MLYLARLPLSYQYACSISVNNSLIKRYVSRKLSFGQLAFIGQALAPPFCLNMVMSSF